MSSIDDTQYQLSPVGHPIAETLGIDDGGNGIEIRGFQDVSHPRVPRKKCGYVFRKDHVRDLRAWLQNPEGDGLMLCGPMGSGKSSIITQLAARTNWPVFEVTGNARKEFADLQGHHSLVNGAMTYVYGPLALAAKYGGLFVLNEADRMDPGELAGLHGVLDGEPLMIAENGGEVIPLHPEFRVILTGNSNGQGDDSGLYQSVVQQDAAFMDRFRVLDVDYPAPEIEKSILDNGVPGLPQQMRDRMVDVANEVRRVFTGGGDNGYDLTVTFSTRTLMRWASMLMQFRSAPNAPEYTLQRALLNRAPASEAEAIRKIAQARFGDLWNPGQSPSNGGKKQGQSKQTGKATS